MNGGDQVERSNQKRKGSFYLLFCCVFYGGGDVVYRDLDNWLLQKRGSVDLSVLNQNGQGKLLNLTGIVLIFSDENEKRKLRVVPGTGVPGTVTTDPRSLLNRKVPSRL